MTFTTLGDPHSATARRCVNGTFHYSLLRRIEIGLDAAAIDNKAKERANKAVCDEAKKGRAISFTTLKETAQINTSSTCLGFPSHASEMMNRRKATKELFNAVLYLYTVFHSHLVDVYEETEMVIGRHEMMQAKHGLGYEMLVGERVIGCA